MYIYNWRSTSKQITILGLHIEAEKIEGLKKKGRKCLLKTYLFWSSPSAFPHLHGAVPINPPPAKENLITSARLCEIRDLLHFILQKACVCTRTKTLTSAQAVNEGERLWQRSVLFTGRLSLLTFIVAPGGRELHANATEAFSAKGPGPPSRHHHKSIHAKINHFHWTPSLRKGRGRGWWGGTERAG